MDARAWLRDEAAEAVDADIREELEAHLALSEEALRAEGRTTDEARSEARERFGDLERTLRACRRVRLGGRLMLVRIQWILIAVLALSTVTMTLFGRQSAREARVQAEHAMMIAREQSDVLAELRSQQRVDEIIVGVGDGLQVVSDTWSQLRQETVVQRDGHALFREVGWVDVAGRLRQQVEEHLRERYAEVYEEVGEVYVIVDSTR